MSEQTTSMDTIVTQHFLSSQGSCVRVRSSAWRASRTAPAGAVCAGHTATGRSVDLETATDRSSAPGDIAGQQHPRGSAGRTRRRTTAAGRAGTRKERGRRPSTRIIAGVDHPPGFL